MRIKVGVEKHCHIWKKKWLTVSLKFKCLLKINIKRPLKELLWKSFKKKEKRKKKVESSTFLPSYFLWLLTEFSSHQSGGSLGMSILCRSMTCSRPTALSRWRLKHVGLSTLGRFLFLGSLGCADRLWVLSRAPGCHFYFSPCLSTYFSLEQVSLYAAGWGKTSLFYFLSGD